MNKKICVFTGSRAEYGLLYWLIAGIHADKDLTLQLIVSGMHLSSDYGDTYKIIEEKFFINKKIDILLSSNSKVSVAKSIGLGLISYSEALEELRPDFVVILGDRFEALALATSAMVIGIHIIHIHGGERSEGVMDESIRHSITKMSHLHFTCLDEYRDRVIQLGEAPSTVFNVGALGIEAILKTKFLTKSEFEASIHFKLKKKNILITFHPDATDGSLVEHHFQNILDALNELKDTAFIFTKANSDPCGKIINKMIDTYVKRNSKKSCAFASLGQLRYYSALNFMDCVIGNSSSGLIEVPSFKIGTLNIGERQRGRFRGDSVVDCANSKQSIKAGLKKIYSKTFQEKLAILKNPYGDGNVSKKIIEILKNYKIDKMEKKHFYDLKI